MSSDGNTPGKLARSEAFKHFLWRRHEDPQALHGHLPELVATDGRTVRRMVGQGEHVSFQCFEDSTTARNVVQSIESSVASGVALLGYAMFASEPSLAVLHTGEGLQPGWIAFPNNRQRGRSQHPTLPIRLVDAPKLRLVAGARLTWRSGKPFVEAALEQAGESFWGSDDAFALLDHLVGWELHARVGVGAAARDLSLQPRRVEPDAIRRPHARRAERCFAVDEAIWSQFAGEPGFRAWFTVEFDRELFCLPADWMRFWLSVKIES